MKRGIACRAHSAFVSLALVSLFGCQELGPTPRSTTGEPTAVTTLALDYRAGEWTAIPTQDHPIEARAGYAGVEVGDGSVLVCGGTTSGFGSPPARTCNRFSFNGDLQWQTFPLPEARNYATLTLLSPERVLLMGGLDADNEPLTARVSSAASSWSEGANIWGAPEGFPRRDHTASLLDSSAVLIGGQVSGELVTQIDVRSEQGAWSRVDPTGTLATRTAHTATVLKSAPGGPARVLILGGYDKAGHSLSSGFIFSLPNTITPIADMHDSRVGHTATLLDDGSVLVVGGYNEATPYFATALRYHPESDSWSQAASTAPRRYHAAVRLGADVIIAGGESSTGYPFAGSDDGVSPDSSAVQRYDSAHDSWSDAPNLHKGRKVFQLFTLDQTHLLAVGGSSKSGPLASFEVFTAAALGQPAVGGKSCLSGFAADGVCCDTECAGACHFCNDASAPGKCQAITGVAPNQRGCGVAQPLCSEGSCPQLCDAKHPCEAGLFCASNGSCTPLLGIGVQCNADNQCADGKPCVDGVCCKSSCSGSCEACNQELAPGTCLPQPEGTQPAPGHAACASGQDSECAAICNGTTRDRCIFPSSTCGNSQCVKEGNSFQAVGECNAKGVCMAKSTSCGLFACDSQNGCFETCTSDTECALGKHCNPNDERCMNCDPDACGALGYSCDSQGECPNTCERSRDCAGGYYCHPLDHRCVQAVAFPAAALPACGIGRQRVGSRLPFAALAAIGALVAARRKRRTQGRAAT